MKNTRRFLVLFNFFFWLGLSSEAQTFQPYQAFIDSTEDDQTVQVFKYKGQTWATCPRTVDKVTKKEHCKSAVGWPGRDAKIKVISAPEEANIIDPISGEEVTEKYVQIEFSYSRVGADGKIYHQKGTGYIELYHLSRSAHNPYFGVKNSPTPDKCIDSKNNSVASDQKKIITDLFQPLSDTTANMDLNNKAAKLGQIVGFCPLAPPTILPAWVTDHKKVDPKTGQINSYDQLILPKLKSMKVPDVKNELGQPMTKEDLINIDALARTLYGEMAVCYRHGLHYPIAVAKIITNRTLNKNQSRFVRQKHAEDKPRLAKEATDAVQFSMWQKRMARRDSKSKKLVIGPNSSLHHGLCPPSRSNRPYWNGEKSSPAQTDIWTNTMRIATEAILHPTKFNRRTKDIPVDLTHYTSGLSHLRKTSQLSSGAKFINSMTQVNPSIEGRKLDLNSCIEIWKE